AKVLVKARVRALAKEVDVVFGQHRDSGSLQRHGTGAPRRSPRMAPPALAPPSHCGTRAGGAKFASSEHPARRGRTGPRVKQKGRDMNQANEPDPRLSMLEAMMTIRAYEHKLVAINAQTGA